MYLIFFGGDDDLDFVYNSQDEDHNENDNLMSLLAHDLLRTTIMVQGNVRIPLAAVVMKALAIVGKNGGDLIRTIRNLVMFREDASWLDELIEIVSK